MASPTETTTTTTTTEVTFVIPGPIPTTDSTPQDFQVIRNRFQQVLREDYYASSNGAASSPRLYPVPAEIEIGLEIEFVLPRPRFPTSMIALSEIAREVLLGPLYQDNGQVNSKAVLQRQAPENDTVGSILVKLQILPQN